MTGFTKNTMQAMPTMSNSTLTAFAAMYQARHTQGEQRYTARFGSFSRVKTRFLIR